MTSNDEIFAIFYDFEPHYTDSFNFIVGEGFTYKKLTNKNLKKVVILNDTPVFIDKDDRLVGFSQQCVQELSAGVDGSLWALACANSTTCDFPLIRWDPIRS